MLATLLGGAASGLGSYFGAKEQAKQANRALKFNRRVYGEGVERMQPFVDAGANALQPYQDALGLGNSQDAINRFQASPNYLLNFQTGLDNANNQLMRQSAAGGSINSGRTLMGLQDRGMDQANQFFGNYLAGIGGLAGSGQNAASGANSFAMQQGQNITGDMYNRGNATAAGYMGVGNSINNTLQDIVQQGGQAFGMGGGGRSTSAYGGGPQNIVPSGYFGRP